MTWAVSCLPVNVKAPIRSQISPCEICGGLSDTRTGSTHLPAECFGFFPVSIFPLMPEALKQSSLFPVIGDIRAEKYFRFICLHF
jgi:hypothetical protein